jgi:hypothetical protein
MNMFPFKHSPIRPLSRQEQDQLAKRERVYQDQHVQLNQRAPDTGISQDDKDEWRPSEASVANDKYWSGLERGVPPFEVAVYNHHAEK